MYRTLQVLTNQYPRTLDTPYYPSSRFLTLKAFTTFATRSKNQDCDALSGINTNLSCSLPDLCAKRMPVSSTVIPWTWVRGSSQSNRSFLDQNDNTLDIVNNTTLSLPGVSTKTSKWDYVKALERKRHTDVCSIKLSTIGPIIKISHPILTHGFTSRISL